MIIKISGSIFDDANKKQIQDISNIIREHYSEGILKGVVVGGGKNAKKYIELSKDNKYIKDIIGIDVARIHALVLASHLLDIVYLPIPKNDLEILNAISSKKLIILGGITPGQSTDAVAMKLAELLDIKTVVFLSNIDGLYDKDPNTHKDAKIIREIKYRDLYRILNFDTNPGDYKFIDPLAVEIGKRSNISIIVTSYENIYNIKPIIDGESNVKYTKIIP